MKRILLLFVCVYCAIIVANAQDVTTMWPYLYSDFQTGTVYFKNKQTLTAAVNIHLLKSTLHYLDVNTIKESALSEIVLVQINNDVYYVCDKQLMRVISGDSTGFVAELVKADFNAIRNSGGAYGSSSNVQAVRKMSSLEIGGINIVNHMELKSRKDAGAMLPLDHSYFIVVSHAVYPAKKRDIIKLLPEEKKQNFLQFIKQHKIEWKRPESLFQLLEFFKLTE